MSMLPIKKIYVDSKFKSNDSISNSNFKITLPQSLTFGPNSVFFIDEIAIPHSWYTIEDFNCRLYLSMFVSANGRDQHIIELSKQVYNGSTLATEILSKLVAIGYPSTVTYNASKQTIIISVDDYDFKILTDVELQEVTWTGTVYDKNYLQSANGVIKNIDRTSIIHNAGNPFVSYIDLQPIRNVYIKSPN